MRIGIDLGGTKIEGIALDDQGRMLFRERVATPRHDYPATIDAICALVSEIENRTGRSGTVGMGIPGTISPASGRVKNANSVWLNGQPLKEDLQTRLQREVRIANDANCFAVSEATDGAAKAADIMFGVIIGTGTGGGICIDKRPLIGVNAIGGEWGHNTLPWPQADELPGAPCYCGQFGCIETWLSGPGFLRDHQQHGGHAGTAHDIVQQALNGDHSAEQSLQRYEQRLARALASIINILDPEVIVLGGGMSNIERLYLNVPRLWQPYVFSDRVDTRLVPPLHGDSSGVRGAAWLWPIG
ncbi:MAG: fructokinase [Gammaproteobacteria bacterium]|nr:fructokinase [Gammaproteobacteria bacterium]MDH5650489.1 fructokinase [Gammaproteobacteria bacterium]